MTASEHSDHRRVSRAVGLTGARLVFLATAILFIALLATGTLSLREAAIGFGILAAATLLAELARPHTPSVTPATSRSDAQTMIGLVEAMLSGLPNPALALDRDGTVVGFNGPAAAFAPALRKGEHASFALRMPEIVEAVRHAASTGEPRRIEFSERVPVDRWYEAHVAALNLHGDREVDGPDLVLVTVNDLTPLRRMEEMRADFVANASHELRTPLATLSGFIETLQGSARDDAPARERFLGIMKQQAFRMARLIDDLLSLSRIELNAHVRPETPVDLVATVRQVTDAMQTLARDRGVEIAFDAPVEPTIVAGDRDELVQVFENLVENALKYGAAGKRVEISVMREIAVTPEAQVTIKDFGPGIPPEHLPRLTERFYRVNVAQSRSEGGTGLGLAIVKHILARHRGRLAIDSILGRGATFTVRLPLTEEIAGVSSKSKQYQ
jgi:two-component system phosphate regulon sensor histidine kinase PhoR